MTRKKVTLAYISNDTERKASFKKRKKGLIKKVIEISTLCGVDACVIIYGQHDSEPAVWPSPAGVEAVLSRFHQLSEMEQMRKMVNQESFTRQRIKKTEDQLRRVRKENNRRELENFMYQCLAGVASLDDFAVGGGAAADMGLVINQVLRDVEFRMEKLGVSHTKNPTPPPPAVEAPPPENMEGLMGNPMGGGGVAGWEEGIVLPYYPYMFNNGGSK